jgi:hypothetical protein
MNEGLLLRVRDWLCKHHRFQWLMFAGFVVWVAVCLGAIDALTGAPCVLRVLLRGACAVSCLVTAMFAALVLQDIADR